MYTFLLSLVHQDAPPKSTKILPFKVYALAVIIEPKPIDATKISTPSNVAKERLESLFTFVFINLPPF